MAIAVFDVVIIFNCEEILGIIPGKGNGLLRQLKDHELWETIMEELDGNVDDIDSIEQIEEAFKNDSENNYSIKVEVVRDVTYKNR